MDGQQIRLVKKSWTYIIIQSDEAGELFYSRLFEVAPHLRPLFKTDIKAQARKLMNMVTVIVAKLERLDTVAGEIAALASRHNRYGAKKEHYAIIGQCLVWTLKTGLEKQKTEDAWIAVYKILSDAMVQNNNDSMVSIADGSQ